MDHSYLDTLLEHLGEVQTRMEKRTQNDAVASAVVRKLAHLEPSD